MTIIAGGLYRIRQKYPDINLSNYIIVGWGAGQFFKDNYPLISKKFSLDYTICPLKENHGKIIHNVKVIAPDEISSFKKPLLIVIFSNHSSIIMNQIRDYFGDIPVISSLDINPDFSLSLELDGFYNSFENFNFSQKSLKNPLFGIVVQGLIYDYTPQILAWNKLRNPDSYQCMVTWDHQSKNIIDKCLPWLDELKLVKQPDILGPFLFNTSIRSCKIGLDLIAKNNINYAVRTRSDSFIVGSIYSILEKYFTRFRNINKIAICLGFAWKNVPFHFSDRLMVGHTESLLNAWSLNEFNYNSNFENFIENYGNLNLNAISNITSESLFWRNFATRLNYQSENLIDSYKFARDLLLPLDPLLTHKSIKLLSLFDLKFDNNLSFDTNSWDNLHKNFDDYVAHAKFIDENAFQLNDLLSKKIG